MKDHKVVVLPLGGSGLINGSDNVVSQLEEIKRIAKNISALIDSEKDAADAPQSSQRRAFVKLCEKLGIDCHVLKRRATENYFSDTAVKAIKGLRYETLDPYGKLSDRQSAWGKNENWRIAREMTREELDETDLGQFLKNLEC